MKARSKGKARKGKDSPPPSPPWKPSKPNDSKSAKVKKTKAKKETKSKSSPSSSSTSSPHGKSPSPVRNTPPRFSSRTSPPANSSHRIGPSPGRARHSPKYVLKLRGGGIPVGRNNPNRSPSTSPRTSPRSPRGNRGPSTPPRPARQTSPGYYGPRNPGNSPYRLRPELYEPESPVFRGPPSASPQFFGPFDVNNYGNDYGTPAYGAGGPTSPAGATQATTAADRAREEAERFRALAERYEAEAERAEFEEDRPFEGPVFPEDLYGGPDDEWDPNLDGRMNNLEDEMRGLDTGDEDVDMDAELSEEGFESDPAFADGPPGDLDNLVDEDILGLNDLPSPALLDRLAAARARRQAIVPNAAVHQAQVARRNQITGSIVQMRAQQNTVPMNPNDAADYALRLQRAELWREVAEGQNRMAMALAGLQALGITEDRDAVEAFDPNAGTRDGSREGFALGMADPVEPNRYRPAPQEEGDEEEES